MSKNPNTNRGHDRPEDRKKATVRKRSAAKAGERRPSDRTTPTARKKTTDREETTAKAGAGRLDVREGADEKKNEKANREESIAAIPPIPVRADREETGAKIPTVPAEAILPPVTPDPASELPSGLPANFEIQADLELDLGLPRPKRRKKSYGIFSSHEVASLAVHFLAKQMPIKLLVPWLHEQYGIVISREQVYALIGEAIRAGYLRPIAPPNPVLSHRLRKKYRSLHGVEVVSTFHHDDVFVRGAMRLVELVQRATRLRGKKQEVHIAVPGGIAVCSLLREFLVLLIERMADMPRRIVIHPSVSAFIHGDPLTDPYACAAKFLKDSRLPLEVRLEELCTPGPFMPADEFEALRRIPSFAKIFSAAKSLDIIVSSTSRFADPDSMLRRSMFSLPVGDLERLADAGCEGDIGILPLGTKGPIVFDPRPATLFDLADVPGFIANGTQVLLVVGPCSGCGVSKAPILKVILEQKVPLITELVVDSHTARELGPDTDRDQSM